MLKYKGKKRRTIGRAVLLVQEYTPGHASPYPVQPHFTIETMRHVYHDLYSETLKNLVPTVQNMCTSLTSINTVYIGLALPVLFHFFVQCPTILQYTTVKEYCSLQ